eukprot:CAMPEP_0118923750 /NCGR_PEP_ID=MMETSP1169-20130426/2165_1 /TAXON_ID=36882 /ORGANISM="Pyramimonas obovata, Strain CCMP722" /LENGTH=317 /DNA_ID=CAMNT_0006864783 /DNA_START=136 /DNA_END=1089 /DNA_ORIENTATION=+
MAARAHAALLNQTPRPVSRVVVSGRHAKYIASHSTIRSLCGKVLVRSRPVDGGCKVVRTRTCCSSVESDTAGIAVEKDSTDSASDVKPSFPSVPPTLVRSVAFAALSLAISLTIGPSFALATGGSGEHMHLGQKIALYLQNFGLPDWVTLVLVSALPAIELRGGVPIGNWMGLSPFVTFLICVAGNMLPIAPVLLGLRSPAVRKLAAPLLKRAEGKLATLPKGQAANVALAVFVGVPAPGTGAWTGAMIAYLLDMPLADALLSILAGVILAGTIMTALTLAGRTGAIVALVALLVFGAGALKAALDKGKKGGVKAAE